MVEIDIYFKEEYGKIYEINNDGKLEKFELKSPNGKAAYSFLKREIPAELDEKYFDIATPYGYGGPLLSDFKDDISKEALAREFADKFEEFCRENRIVSEFVRFHPLLQNNQMMENYMEVVHNRNTIAIDLNQENIFDQFEPTCRNKIRKALKNEVTVKSSENPSDDLDSFYSLYISTMDKNNALEYYYFSKDFFRNTLELLKGNIKIFNAFYQGRVISSAIIMYSGDYMHYHFSGSSPEYRNLAGNNLLLYEAALWGQEKRIKYFHLGGGHKGDEDALYKFKQSFSKDRHYEFYIGKKIHNEEIYKKLVEEAQKNKKIENLSYFPLYRG